ncbi:T9SS type A sorting domain-containing protein [Chryseobacterium sp. LAM-KRS1]|uniref:T9SS type A sorting domain-containing protein n=1 Tax=Chryseobacterium sp. LAM-KRS1 TaxID=2715754 RepID=UPI0015532B0D|nr:T9SS type A sorting domain-containing protein [Chryseobacterium sp. LAM-KRS1]
MKKTLLSLILLTSVMGTAQTLLSENFEGTTFPPTGWTRSSTVSTRPWDLSTTNFPGTSAQAIQLRDTFTITGNNSATIDWIAQANTANLVSPVFSLAGTTNPVLKFNVVVGWSYMINQNLGNLIAQVTTDGGATWNTVWTEDTEPGFQDDGDGDEDTDLYNTVAVQKSLTPYAGQTNVQVRFQYTGNNADAVAIDDIQILASGTLSVNEISSRAKTGIYPNPTKGEVEIRTDKKIKSISVFDFSGKSVLKTASVKADLSSLPKGNYLMQIEFNDGTSTSEKIIKE